jgi:hypothetical protein
MSAIVIPDALWSPLCFSLEACARGGGGGLRYYAPHAHPPLRLLFAGGCIAGMHGAATALGMGVDSAMLNLCHRSLIITLGRPATHNAQLQICQADARLGISESLC